jgi:hypothetical protein
MIPCRPSTTLRSSKRRGPSSWQGAFRGRHLPRMRPSSASTLDHLTHLGFRRIFLLLPEGMCDEAVAIPRPIADMHVIHGSATPRRQPGTVQAAVNALIEVGARPMDSLLLQWLSTCSSPFCEQRRVGELTLAFVIEERRNTVLGYVVIDLYAERSQPLSQRSVARQRASVRQFRLLRRNPPQRTRTMRPRWTGSSISTAACAGASRSMCPKAKRRIDRPATVSGGGGVDDCARTTR